MTLYAKDRNWLYLATDGKLLKIGMSIAPDERMKSLRSPRLVKNNWPPCRLLRVWYMEGYASRAEQAVKDHFRHKLASYPTEWFHHVSQRKICEFVEEWDKTWRRTNPLPSNY